MGQARQLFREGRAIKDMWRNGPDNLRGLQDDRAPLAINNVARRNQELTSHDEDHALKSTTATGQTSLQV